MFSRSTRLASASRTRPLRAFAARHNATQAVADILPAAPSSSAPPRQPDTTPAPEDTPTQGDPSGPQPTRDAKPRRPTKALEPRKPEKSRSVFVSPGRPIRDILEALALLRGVEKELGPAQEFKFPRVSNSSLLAPLSLQPSSTHCSLLCVGGRGADCAPRTASSQPTTVPGLL
jgi:hypothetical protein